MKHALFLVCLLPSITFAQYTPAYGCFVQNYTNYCSTGTVTCSVGSGVENANYLAFGTTVGELCNRYNSCLGSVIDNSDGWDSCISQYNALVSPYNKNLSLIKRLRKACGSKCKRIK